MQVGTDLGGNVHILFGLFRAAVDKDVNRGNDFGFGELPDVQLVEVENAFDGLNGLADGFEADRSRDTLEEDVGGGLAEGQRRVEDDDGDEERDGWVRVESPPCVGVHDEEASCDNTDVAKSIAKDVEENTLHVHTTLPMRVTASVRVAVTGSIVWVSRGAVRMTSVGVVRMRRVTVLGRGRSGTGFKVGIGIDGTVVVGSVGKQTSALVIVVAEGGDRVGVLVARAVVAEIVGGLDDECAGLGRVTKDGADTVLTTATTLCEGAADAIVVGGRVGLLATNGDRSDSVTYSRFVKVRVRVGVRDSVRVRVAVSAVTVTAMCVRVTVSGMSVTVVVEE